MNHLPNYSWTDLICDVRQDIAIYQRFAGEYSAVSDSFVKRLSAFLTPSVISVFLFRLSHWCYARHRYRIALIIAIFNQALSGVSIAPSSVIGAGLYIPHPATSIVFSGYAGNNLCLFAGAAVGPATLTPLFVGEQKLTPRIGNHVSLGAKSQLRGDITVGDHTKIGFNCVITDSIKSGATVVSSHVRNHLEPATPDS